MNKPSPQQIKGANAPLSLSGKVWQNALSSDQLRAAAHMAQTQNIPEILAKLLIFRGVNAQSIEDYINPTLRTSLPDPSTLQDMDKAVARLVQAIDTQEKITIFGDYDVDGACSSALMAQYLNHLGCKANIIIPDRIVDGYGPNVELFDEIIQQGSTLIITVDCGSLSYEPIAHAQNSNVDVIVLDHHQIEQQLPNATAVVNPNRADDLSGLGTLCATGVVFMVLVALNRELKQKTSNQILPDLLSFLDLVALATVADVVPLVGLNRVFVVQGLKRMSLRERLGLNALFDVAKLNGPPNVYALGFVLGPRINAGGRIGDVALGAKLLLEKNQSQAEQTAQKLNQLNLERQKLEEEATTQAYIWAEQKLENHSKAIVLGSKVWHPGILGLIAARLKSRFNLPAVAIAWREDGTGTASARSIEGVDLGALMRSAVQNGLLIKGGGHAMAAGLTLHQEKLDDFEAFLQNNAIAEKAQADAAKIINIEAILNAGALSVDLAKNIQSAGPFGAGNKTPVFMLQDHQLKSMQPVGKGHLRLRVASQDNSAVDIMFFRGAETDLAMALENAIGQNFNFALTISVDTYMGKEKVSCQLQDVSLP